jgi:putative membrane protein
MKKLILLFIISALVTSIALAQAPDPDTTARHFIIMASIGNLQDISTGKLAVEKATRPDVRSFGQMMITDHSNTQAKLMQLANSKGIQLPAEATATPPRDLNLSKTSGDDFDRLYIHSMLAGHGSTVQMFETYATTGKDPDVRAFAQQTLPTLKAHLAAIKAIDEKYKYLTAK